MKILRLGTRGSKLALWQAEFVGARLQQAIAGLQVEVRVIKTSGDKILDTALSKIGDKGLFTKEIEKELLTGTIDLAVHSLKDMPSDMEKGLILGAVLEREDPQDVLISYKRYKFSQLPENAVIGTSSLRRVAQIKAVRPDIRVVDLRGNVESRINKMIKLNMDGIVLAFAGVKRLACEEYISDFLPYSVIMPAVGQGAVAVELRDDDPDTLAMVKKIDDNISNTATRAERAFMKELQGGCQVPVAALAEVQEDRIVIQGLIASLDGTTVLRDSCMGYVHEAESLGKQLARQLLAAGGERILGKIRHME